ncbi:hypothetical protein [Rhizobium johnstonii]|uniref:hypothetical protein n=1 Tax=Rhizobium johnstonii TaxID=3019933 RepID=UPI003F9CDE3D
MIEIHEIGQNYNCPCTHPSQCNNGCFKAGSRETVIKSAKGNQDRLITIAKALDGVVICSGTDADPNRSMVCILDEDFPEVFRALQLINNEMLERYTI